MNRMRFVARRLLNAVVVCGWVLAVGGCGGSQGPPASDAQTAVPRLPPPPRRTASAEAEPEPEPPPAQPEVRHPVGPWMEWRVAESDVVPGKSFLKLITDAGPENVLELTSYDAPIHEEFPSFYLRAHTRATSLKDLVNQPLDAQLYIYVQTEKDWNVLHNLPQQKVEFVVQEIDGKNVRGTFSGDVHDVELGGDGPISGKFQAIVEPPAAGGA